MQTQATATKEKEKTSGSHKPYTNPLTFVRPAATKMPDPVEIIRRVRQNPASLSREDKLALQRTLGNRAVVQLLSSLKDGRKEEKKTDNSSEAKQGEQAQGLLEKSAEERESAHAVQRKEQEAVQSVRVEAVPAVKRDQTASDLKLQKQEQGQGKEQRSIATNPSGLIPESKPTAQVKPKGTAKENPAAQKASPGVEDSIDKPPNVEAKSGAAEAKKEEAADPNAKGSGKEQTVEHTEAQAGASKDGKSGKGRGKETTSETAQKAAPKEPSLGDALGALAGVGKEEPAKAKKVNIRGEDPGQILDQLTHVQPTEIGDAYAQAVDVSTGALAKQKQKTKQGMPVIPAPTGLKGKALQARRKIAPLKHDVSDGFKSERSGGNAQPGNLGRMDIGSSGSDGNPEAMLGEIRSAAAVPPEISLTGEADPSQLEGFNQEASQQVGAAKRAELGQINHPFGENDIYPEPDGSTLKASAELQGGHAPGAKKLPVLGVPADMTAGLNHSLAPEMKKQLGAKQAEYSKEKAKFDSKVQLSKADSHAQIQQAEAEAKDKQLNQQAGAKAEVDQLRGEWKNELDAAEADYAGQAGAAAQQKKGEINSVRAEKEREAQTK
ncbi:hypothetical protein SAMN05216191_101973, partial [Paenibacillus jilunlii]